MFSKNWKTSLTGLAMLLTGISDVVHGLASDPAAIKWEADLIAITGGIGLLFAKDGNVTGGSSLQPTPEKVLLAQAVEHDKAGL